MSTRSQRIEEPDVTPLINVNLVVLVMVVLISAAAVRLLPLVVPKVDSAGGQGRSVSLAITPAACEFRAGRGRAVLADPAALAAAVAEGEPADGWALTVADGQIQQAGEALAPGTVVTVTLAEGAGRDRLGRALKGLRHAGQVEVVMDSTCAVPLTVGERSYDLAGQRGMDGDALADAVAGLDEGSIVLIRLDGEAKYDRLVRALEPILARGDLEVAFGQAGGPKVVAGKPKGPAGGPATAVSGGG